MEASLIDWIERHSSGLTLVYDDVPSVGTTALALFIAVGSRDEGPEEWGTAHCLEHLAFKGAGPWDFRAIARAMDQLGADVNAFTTRDYTCFHARVLDGSALSAYRLLAYLVREPWLRSEDLEREKNVISEEMRESQDDPDDVLDTLLTEASFADPAYTHDILGTRESVSGLDSSRVQSFYRRWYRPEYMVLAVSGGARDAILQEAQQDFSGRAVATALPRRRPRPAWRAGALSAHADWEQLHLGLSIPAVGRYDVRYPAALMTAGILGGQNSSRLWQRLREEEGLVYTVACQYGAEFDFGDTSVYLSLGPNSWRRAVGVLAEEVDRLATHGPTPEELQGTSASLSTMLVMSQETADARVMRLGRAGLDQQLPLALPRLCAQLEAVGGEEVRREAAQWLDWEQAALAMVGPLDDGMQRIRALLQGRGVARA